MSRYKKIKSSISFFSVRISAFKLKVRVCLWYTGPFKLNVPVCVWYTGFYLGYLNGRSFPPKSPAPPPPTTPPPTKNNILSSLRYISNYIRKNIQTPQGQCKHSNINFLKSVSQNTPDCISSHIHFKNYRWAFPRPPFGNSWSSATRDFSPKQ